MLIREKQCFFFGTISDIVFWGNWTNMERVFLLQKNILRIMIGLGPRCCCKGLFKNLDTLPVPCLYSFSLMLFVVNNPNNFQTSLMLHSINIRYKNQLHRPTVNLSCIQKGVTYCAIKIYNSLPSDIWRLQNDKSKFKLALRKYLITDTFYSFEEFFSHHQKSITCQFVHFLVLIPMFDVLSFGFWYWIFDVWLGVMKCLALERV
jgi:hypothetical protein